MSMNGLYVSMNGLYVRMNGLYMRMNGLYVRMNDLYVLHEWLVYVHQNCTEQCVAIDLCAQLEDLRRQLNGQQAVREVRAIQQVPNPVR